ncbi:unnamed protein product [Pieris macdunnoughi]|uniref:Uncharacterized protein n=1 Tax=Pieris macdunnoughi TaxID=345717 RepID=A0A821UW50_9NEOP|nr:unnamed protein product [Pieris macdunnoughi]
MNNTDTNPIMIGESPNKFTNSNLLDPSRSQRSLLKNLLEDRGYVDHRKRVCDSNKLDNTSEYSVIRRIVCRCWRFKTLLLLMLVTIFVDTRLHVEARSAVVDQCMEKDTLKNNLANG